MLRKRRLLELKVGECLFSALLRYGLLSLFRGSKLFVFETRPAAFAVFGALVLLSLLRRVAGAKVLMANEMPKSNSLILRYF